MNNPVASAPSGEELTPVPIFLASLQKYGSVSGQANSGVPLRGDFERMARRRFQDPKPARRGAWWTLLCWTDVFENGERRRKRKRIKLGPATMPEREVRKIAAEALRPMNQGLETIGSATTFSAYVEGTYKPLILPLLAKPTRDRYTGVIKNYLEPAFGSMMLRDMTKVVLQRYFSEMADWKLQLESKDKIRNVLASVLNSAEKYQLIVKNPIEGVQLPRGRRGKRNKPIVTPEQFAQLIELIPEPYATMLFVAVFTGLRVSELIALRWKNVGVESITIDERYCRGDWDVPKSSASNATIGVNHEVIERLHLLKGLTIEVKAGRAIRRYPAVKSSLPNDLVFQSVQQGKPMRDNNILTRFIKPAARKLGLDFVNWRCLRTSHATWLKMVGADVKDAQAQLRHSRASTTLDIYQQFVPESQKKAVERLSSLSHLVH